MLLFCVVLFCMYAYIQAFFFPWEIQPNSYSWGLIKRDYHNNVDTVIASGVNKWPNQVQ